MNAFGKNFLTGCGVLAAITLCVAAIPVVLVVFKVGFVIASVVTGVALVIAVVLAIGWVFNSLRAKRAMPFV